MSKLQDKIAILHVLGSLINDPTLLSNSKGYNLSYDDFPDKMHKIVFSSIYNLYQQGMEQITVTDVQTYLMNFPEQYATFNANEGEKYLDKLAEIGSAHNFEYFFNRIRKFSYLRECKATGIDVSDIYDDSLLEAKEIELMESKFNNMSLDEMVNAIYLKFITLKEKYIASSESVSEHMSEGAMENLMENLKAPSYGANFQSKFSNTITRGCKAKKFYLRSAPTGGGKTRYNLADLLEICIQEKWDGNKNKWYMTGSDGAGLFITTEIPKEDIQLACLCHIACVDEDKVKDNDLNEGEMNRLKRAVEILEQSNLRIEHLEDFDLEQIELTIEKNILKYDVRYVVFDYIHTSLRLLTAIGNQAKGLREDLILLILSAKLKDIANKYEISMISSTQMNDNWKQDGMQNLDQSSIRGSKAIADKIDTGMILLPISKDDRTYFEEEVLPMLKQTKEYNELYDGFGKKPPTPTHTLNYYKNRESKWNNIRVWLNIDMGTLRTTDVCVTRYDKTLVENIRRTTINENLRNKVAEINDNRVNENKELKLEINSEDIEKSLFTS